MPALPRGRHYRTGADALADPERVNGGLPQVGVPIERVSVLFGHSSIKVTEKYYSPWVRARQEQLEADVRRSWAPPEHGTRPVA
jgi:hypothetical protein